MNSARHFCLVSLSWKQLIGGGVGVWWVDVQSVDEWTDEERGTESLSERMQKLETKRQRESLWPVLVLVLEWFNGCHNTHTDTHKRSGMGQYSDDVILYPVPCYWQAQNNLRYTY